MKRLLLVLLLAGVWIVPAGASVALTNAATARIDFGDLGELNAANTLAVVFTVKLTASTSTGQFMVHQFGTTDASACFLFDVVDNDEIRFLIHGSTGTGNYYGWKTQSVNLTNGNTYRIGGKWISGSMTIWVNGVSQTLTQTNSQAATTLVNSSVPVQVGYNSTRSANGVEGEYSELAIWVDYSSNQIPTYFMEAYGKGFSPGFYNRTAPIRLIYVPMFNTSALGDRWRAHNGTNSGGTSAGHPPMYYPAAVGPE